MSEPRGLSMLLCAAIAACSDDQTDLDSGPAAEAGESSTGALPDDGAFDDGDGLADEAGGDEGDESDDGRASVGGAGGSGVTEGDTEGAAPIACMPAVVFDALQQHALDVRASSLLLAGQPSADQVTGFLLAPGLAMPPALPIVVQGDGMPCEQPGELPLRCENGSCMQVQCTASGWVTVLGVPTPAESDGFVYTRAYVRTEWNEGATGTTFRIRTNATTPEGADFSMFGRGSMDVDGFRSLEEFAGLHPAGTVLLSLAESAAGSDGALRIADVVVAETDASGQLQPTGACP